jgi:hypothetical protein
MNKLFIPFLAALAFFDANAQVINPATPAAKQPFSTSATYNTATLGAKAQQSLSVKDFGAVCDGSTNDYTAIAAAVTALGSNGNLIFPNNAICKFSSNLSIPNGVNLSFAPGSGLKAGTSAITLTTGNVAIVAADTAQIFYGFGTNKITLNSGYSNATPVDCSVDWFGVNDGSNTDQIAANNAIFACNTVHFNGQYVFGAEMLVPYGGVNGGHKHVYGRGPQSIVLAGSDSINLIHWSDSFGKLDNLTLSGNGHTGTTGLRVTPEDETQLITTVNQNNNAFENLYFTSGDESIVMSAGPAPGAAASGCWYNTFRQIFGTSSKRILWLKDNTGADANRSGCNSNIFFGLLSRGSINTAIQIDAGGGNTFYGAQFEQITSGASPNATPTGIKIADVMSNGGANPNNVFTDPHWESVTRHAEINNAMTAFYNSDRDASLTTGTATIVKNTPTDLALSNFVVGGIRSLCGQGSECLRVDANSNLITGLNTNAAGATITNGIAIKDGVAPTTYPSGVGQFSQVSGTLTIYAPDGTATVLSNNGGQVVKTVAQGGTGVAALGAHGLLIGNGGSNVVVSGAGTTGQFLRSNGASSDPTYQALGAENATSLNLTGGGVTWTNDNTYNLGAIGASRPANIYAGTSVQAPSITASAVLTGASASLTGGGITWVNDNTYNLGGTSSGRPANVYAGTSFVAGGITVYPSLAATTSSIGGAVTVGTCDSGTVAVTGSTTSMTVSVSPNTYPGDGYTWYGYVSTNGTVTVKVCGLIVGTPTSSTYNVRVIQ